MKKILLLTLLAAFIVGGLAYNYYPSSTSPFIPTVKEPDSTPASISPVVPEPIVTTKEVRSPDGSMKLIMKKTKNENSAVYSFVVSGPESENIEIYTKTLAVGEMNVPLNSWAPDNKYLFIEENDGTNTNYLIFKATGEEFLEGVAYIDFLSHYNEKMKQHTLRDVTGWDAPGLLYVRTSGPAYWFELGSNAFYQLIQR
ncbi:MAG: hypothetical protein WD967_01480 [Candidatus Levyibacteriota bacterium]